MDTTKRNAILEQLAIGSINAIGWISDGSSSKVHEGVLVAVECNHRGLIVTIQQDNGRSVRVCWRMSRMDAECIVVAYEHMVVIQHWRHAISEINLSELPLHRTYVRWVARVDGYACELMLLDLAV